MTVNGITKKSMAKFFAAAVANGRTNPTITNDL